MLAFARTVAGSKERRCEIRFSGFLELGGGLDSFFFDSDAHLCEGCLSGFLELGGGLDSFRFGSETRLCEGCLSGFLRLDLIFGWLGFFGSSGRAKCTFFLVGIIAKMVP